MKRLLSLSAAAALLGSAAFAEVTIGVSWSNFQEERWKTDEAAIVSALDAAGAKYVSADAQSSSSKQLSDIESLIAQGVDALIILAQDSQAVGPAVQAAADEGIPVIAYDRLIRDSAYVDYYATFDNFKVGVQQATSLVEGLKARFGDGPYNVELFGGSPDDNNAYFFYNGAMSVLDPLIADGTVNIVSGQMGMDTVGTLRWDGAVAQARMDNLLSAHYTDKEIHGVLSPYDGLSIGILSSLKGVGYGSGDQKMPIVSGQDAEVPSVKSMLANEQYSTIFKDTRELARVTVGMVDAVLEGGEPEINDTSTYDNGVKVIPSYLLEPVAVDLSNWEGILIDSGYYSADQIK